jgi:hypothetical protein
VIGGAETMNEHSNHPIYHPATHRGLGHQLDKVCDPRTAVVVATEACIARSKPVSFTRPLPFAAGEHRPSIEPTIEGDAPGGFPQAANGFRPHPKRLSPLSPRGRKGRTSLCEWPDSNPTHTSRDDQPSRVPAVTTQACAAPASRFRSTRQLPPTTAPAQSSPSRVRCGRPVTAPGLARSQPQRRPWPSQ